MDPKTTMHYRHRALVMKALAHPTRLFLVDRLAKNETCVCELAALVGADISTISRHLSVLKSAGIVADEKRGNQVFYSLRVRCVLNWYTCVEGVLEAAAQEQLVAGEYVGAVGVAAQGEHWRMLEEEQHVFHAASEA